MSIETRLTKVEEAQREAIAAETVALLETFTDAELEAIIGKKIGQPIEFHRLTDEELEAICTAPVPEETLADQVRELAFLRLWIAEHRAGVGEIAPK